MDVTDLTLDELRRERMRCRRKVELLTLRHGQGTSEALRDRQLLAVLTDELIRRYSANLALVDSLLEPAYPRDVGHRR